MEKKVFSLAALALFMVSNLNAAEESYKCDLVAMDVHYYYLDTGASHGAAYELSEIAYDECMSS